MLVRVPGIFVTSADHPPQFLDENFHTVTYRAWRWNETNTHRTRRGESNRFFQMTVDFQPFKTLSGLRLFRQKTNIVCWTYGMHCGFPLLNAPLRFRFRGFGGAMAHRFLREMTAL